MNMNKALQNLYHAVSGSTTTKVNISKLLVDIHYAITGVESSVKNNWSRIIDSMATNWPEGGGGGGGSSDFSTAEMTIVNTVPSTFAWACPWYLDDSEFPCAYGDIAVPIDSPEVTFDVIMYKGKAWLFAPHTGAQISISGNIEEDGTDYYIITGDCTITIS